jgi:DNA-binding CsgD family transcriptional regulator
MSADYAQSAGAGGMMNSFALEPDLEHLVFDTIVEAHQVGSTEELSRLFERACEKLGFSHFGAFSVLDPKGHTIGSYEAGMSDSVWRDHYIQQDHFCRDAIVRLIPKTLEPIVWRDLSASGTLSDEEQRVFDEAAEFGHRDGYVLPLHYTNGAVAVTILGAPQAIPSNARTRAATHILSAYFSMGVRRLMAPLAAPPRVHLSPRQRECLQWVRAGKSDADIGDILGLSEHTVRGHVEVARKRFGVRTRTQAVIEALNQGLISL